MIIKTSSNGAFTYYVQEVEVRQQARYSAAIIMRADYYPFGMVMPGRHTDDDSYRYGYNGMERDNEAKGDGNSYTTEFRQYDPRLGRWLSLDPLMHQFPWMSPYVAFNNNPVFFTDPLGLEGDPPKTNGTENQGDKSGDWTYHCDDETSYLDGWRKNEGNSYGNSLQDGLSNARNELRQLEMEHAYNQGAYQNERVYLNRKLNKNVDAANKQSSEIEANRNKIELMGPYIRGINYILSVPYETRFRISLSATNAILDQLNPNRLLPSGAAISCGWFDPFFDVAQDGVKSGLETTGMSEENSSMLAGGIMFLGNIVIARKAPSLGAGRTTAKQWLQTASSLERGQLISDIESVGFIRVSPLTSPSAHYKRGGITIRLDGPDTKTPFDHMHINYGGNKNAYDINLKRINYKLEGAHIPIK